MRMAEEDEMPTDWLIQRVKVGGLFGNLEHEFDLDSKNTRAILIGPNGVGKTKLLNLVKALLNLEISILLAEPFRLVEISFQNGEVLRCERQEHPSQLTRSSSQSVNSILLSLNYADGNAEWAFSSKEYNQFEDWAEDRLLLRRRRGPGPKQWKLPAGLMSTDRLLNYCLTDEGESKFGPVFGGNARIIKGFLGHEKVCMVGADRLAGNGSFSASGDSSANSHLISDTPDIVSHIRKEFEDARLDYVKVSQSLDSTFPQRLLNEQGGGGRRMFDTENEFRAVYEVLRENFRETTRNVGVDEIEMAPLPDRRLEGWEIEALTLHVLDGMAKINSLTDLSQRVDIFEKLVNAKLVRSKIVVEPTGIFLRFADGQLVSPRGSNLSSGERHQIRMAFDLVFRSRSKRLVLVDEPELSLHVNWQAEILDEFESLREVNDFQYIVATHSPEIIGDAWEAVRPLTLKSEQGGEN